MALQPVMFPEIEGPDFVRSTEVTGVAEDVLRIHGKVVGDRSLVSVELASLHWDDQAGVWREGAPA